MSDNPSTVSTATPKPPRHNRPCPKQVKERLDELFADLLADVPAKELKRLPSDLAERHDDYLTGTRA